MNDSGVFLKNKEVWILDKCRCQYCGLSGLGNFDAWMNLTIDQVPVDIEMMRTIWLWRASTATI